MFDFEDTIAAIASARGGAIRGVLRVSGPAAVSVVSRCFQSTDGVEPSECSRPTAIVGLVDLGGQLGQVPADLYLWPTSRSYTRQPSAELHTIGSPPLLDAAMRSLLSAGARLAEPGEFTMRAFLAGRLDLTQAEAVLGVIDARDASELRVALGQLAGGLASPLNELRDELLDLLAHLEAGLDFVDEDIEFITAEELDRRLAAVAARIDNILTQAASRGMSDAAYPVVLRGLPNVGKSSLLNALCGDAAAIVSETAGTTRDYVARAIDLHGIECLLIDTAGVELPSDDAIQRAAQHAATNQQAHARLELLCVDASRPLDAWEHQQMSTATESRLVVQTKADLVERHNLPGSNLVSSMNGEGIERLRDTIRDCIERLWHHDSSIVSSTAARCSDSLRAAFDAIGRAREAAANCFGEEIVAAEMRGALDELGRVVGAVYTDDVLDRIFSRFCIGK